MSRLKGYKHFNITKEKIGNGHRGKIISEEQRKKQSEAMKELYASGYKHPMLGRNHSEETREKQRQARLGKPISEFTKQRVRETQTGRIVSQDIRNKIKKFRLGKKANDITKEKLKVIALKRWKDKNYRDNFSKSRIGKNNPNWHDGIQFAPYDINWNRNFKDSIRKRDNQICMNCGIHREKLNYSLEIHHIDYIKINSVKENCISLCKSCHSLTQINRIFWTRLFYTKLAHLYGYKYTENFQIINNIDVMKGGITNKDVRNE
jgi:hypothetical protein